MEHPYKVMQDAVAMYSCRITVALEERTARHRRVGTFVIMSAGATRIVPDMRVVCLTREQLLERVDLNHPSVPGAIALMDGADDALEVVPFGVVFPDGGVMVTTMQIHDADRDRRG